MALSLNATEEPQENRMDMDEEVYYDTYSKGGNELTFQDGSIDVEENRMDMSEDFNQPSSMDMSVLDTQEPQENRMNMGDEDGSKPTAFSEKEAKLDKDFLGSNLGVIPRNPENEVTKEFFMSDNAQISIGMFMKSRYGKSGIKKDGETNDEYAERFFNKMRWMQNNMASTGSGLAWLHGADETTKNNFGILYSQFNEMPAFYESGGGNAGQGVWDTVASVVFDPANVATLGIATGFKILGGRLAAHTVLSNAIKSNAGRIAGAASVEGILGAMQAGNLQSLEIEANQRTDKDWNTILAMGALSAGVSGGINIAVFRKGLRDATYKDKILKQIDEKRTELGLDPDGGAAARGETKDVVFDEANGPLAAQIEDVTTVFDAAYDMNITNASLNGDVRKRSSLKDIKEAHTIVATLISAIPSLGPRTNETITQAFHRSFFTLDMADDRLLKEIDDELINKGFMEGNKGHNFEQAMTTLKAELDEMKITPAQFAAITDTDVSHAGKVLNLKSQLSKVIAKLNRSKGIDVEPNAMATAKREDIINASWAMRMLSHVGSGIHSADRVRRALMTSQPATTARNVISGTAAVTMHIASRVFRNTYAAIGHSASAVNPYNPSATMSFQGTVDGSVHIVSDAFSMLGDIFNHGQNRELVDLILQDNAILHHSLLRTTQEAGINSLPKSVVMLNALNIAQDQFLRTGVFMNSVKRQMKELGKVDDFMAHLATGGKIPTDIAQHAVDEALAITFANVPKNILAKSFVKGVEALPFVPVIGTGAFPFARFMANAVTFQFRYLPTNSIAALFNRSAAKKLILDPDAVGGERLLADSARQFSDGIVGAAGIVAGVYYRYDKQDTTTYDEVLKDDGSTMAVGAIFPLPFYLMLGDLIVKARNGRFGDVRSGDVMQAMTGWQASAGGVNYFLDNFMQVMSDNGIGSDFDVASEKFADAIGKYTGELAGQYATPAKLVRDILAAFDEEQNLKRDANIVTSKGMGPRFVESFINKASSNLPYQLKEYYDGEALPAQESAVRGEDQYNVSPVLTQFTGMKISPARKPVENEMMVMGLKPYLMLTPTGDKQADALIRKHMPQFIDEVMTPIIESEYYQKSSRATKKNIMNDAKSMVIKYAKSRAEQDFAEARQKQGYSPKERAKWMRISKDKRKEINERWFSQYGETIEQSNSYEAGASLAKSTGL